MHHKLSRPEWLQEINYYLPKNGSRKQLDFDQHFVLVENDWLTGREPEDVAEAIANGTHKHFAAQAVAPLDPTAHENQR